MTKTRLERIERLAAALGEVVADARMMQIYGAEMNLAAALSIIEAEAWRESRRTEEAREVSHA